MNASRLWLWLSPVRARSVTPAQNESPSRLIGAHCAPAVAAIRVAKLGIGRTGGAS